MRRWNEEASGVLKKKEEKKENKRGLCRDIKLSVSRGASIDLPPPLRILSPKNCCMRELLFCRKVIDPPAAIVGDGFRLGSRNRPIRSGRFNYPENDPRSEAPRLGPETTGPSVLRYLSHLP